MIHDLVGIGLVALLFSFAFLVVVVSLAFIKMTWSDE